MFPSVRVSRLESVGTQTSLVELALSYIFDSDDGSALLP